MYIYKLLFYVTEKENPDDEKEVEKLVLDMYFYDYDYAYIHAIGFTYNHEYPYIINKIEHYDEHDKPYQCEIRVDKYRFTIEKVNVYGNGNDGRLYTLRLIKISEIQGSILLSAKIIEELVFSSKKSARRYAATNKKFKKLKRDWIRCENKIATINHEDFLTISEFYCIDKKNSTY